MAFEVIYTVATWLSCSILSTFLLGHQGGCEVLGLAHAHTHPQDWRRHTLLLRTGAGAHSSSGLAHAHTHPQGNVLILF